MSHPVHDSTDAPPADRRALPRRRARTLLAVLCLVQFMLVLDVTVVNVALPSIAADLQLSALATPWVINAYVVAFGGLMLLGGRLADAYGQRFMLVLGLIIFVASSALCAASADESMLLLGRVLQGVGAALMSPAALSSLTRSFNGHGRLRALAAWAGVASSGFAAGLIVGGVLTNSLGWQSIFAINVVTGLVVAPFIVVLVPRASDGDRGRVDVVGGVLATLIVGAVVYAITALAEMPERWTEVAISAAVALVAAFGFVVASRRAVSPLIPPRVLRRRSVVAGLLVMIAATGGMLSLYYLASAYLQIGLGGTPLWTGIAFLPAALTILASAHLSTRLIATHGAREVAIGSFLVASGGAALLSLVWWQAESGWIVVGGLIFASAGLGPLFVVATSTTMSAVSPTDTGSASGIVNTGHELGGAMGVAGVSAVVGSILTASAADFSRAFVIVAVATGAMALAARWLVPPIRVASGHGHGH
ncbi:MFS transporter [Microbacterium sp. NPDC058345]|uniref:MFS transporter n=1 Tax=Microbacterium sp. NPDC058345 TaxID=3346455 RepID=UPI003648DC95